MLESYFIFVNINDIRGRVFPAGLISFGLWPFLLYYSPKYQVHKLDADLKVYNVPCKMFCMTKHNEIAMCLQIANGVIDILVSACFNSEVLHCVLL